MSMFNPYLLIGTSRLSNEAVSDEFQKKHILYNPCNPTDFYQSQWFKNKWIYCFCKFALFAYWFGFFVAGLINSRDIGTLSFYWIFLTNWGVWILLLYFILSFVLVIYGIFIDNLNSKKSTSTVRKLNTVSTIAFEGNINIEEQTSDNSRRRIQWIHIVVWILYEISLGTALLITVLYWALLPNRNTSLHSVNVHIINAVIMLIDCSLNALPFRILHVYNSMLFGFVYSIFTVILFASNFIDAVYPFLNWNTNPGLAAGASILVIFVAIPLFHMLAYGLHSLKLFIYGRVTNSGDTRTQSRTATQPANYENQAYSNGID